MITKEQIIEFVRNVEIPDGDSDALDMLGELLDELINAVDKRSKENK